VDPLRSSPAVLLHHDGELDDVRQLLDDMGVRHVERLGVDCEPDHIRAWDVIIASPRRIMKMSSGAMAYRATRIAIIDGDSRTLRAHLRRMRIDWMVRRPVHPAALRLLVLHALYRGPERRRKRRVSIGAEVRYRSGLRRYAATLTDFSLRGCRLLGTHPVVRGRRIRIQLPAAVTGARPFQVTGTVVRSSGSPGSDPTAHVMAIRFPEPTGRLRERLEAILVRHASGPATLAGRPSRTTDANARPATAKTATHRATALASPGHESTPAPRDVGSISSPPDAPHEGTSDPANEPVSAIGATPTPEAFEPVHDAAPDTGTDVAAAERRRQSRHVYDRRVVALGERATRVLIGRDISTGGMRVGAHAELALGERLKIALHAGGRSEPLIVAATVQRDDGERGLVLRFEDIDESTRATIEGLVEDWPEIESGDGDESQAGLVVSEIIEREAG